MRDNVLVNDDLTPPLVELFRLPQTPLSVLTVVLPPTECSYLPNRVSRIRLIPRAEAPQYQLLMDRNFRRSGEVFYRPECPGCTACTAIRVPVAAFRPSRSQRRVWSRSRDIRLEIGPPRADRQRFVVYCAYQHHVHGGRMAMAEAHFEHFWNGPSPIETLEFSYWLGTRLVGAGLVDVAERCLSSVYFFYDPALSKRSPGVYSALCEIEECRRRQLPYWYAGYWIAGCAKMEYKSSFRPYELLGADSVWRGPRDARYPADARGPSSDAAL